MGEYIILRKPRRVRASESGCLASMLKDAAEMGEG